MRNKFPKGQPAKAGIGARNKAIKDNVAIAVSKPMDGLAQTYEKGMPRAKQLFADAFQQLSALAATQNIDEAQLQLLHDYCSSTLTGDKCAAQEIAAIIRARALDVVLKRGQPTETGSIKWTLPDGGMKEARIQRSGLNGKLVEAQLRARSLRLEKYMMPTTSYELMPDTEQKLIADKVFTADEMKSLKYAPSYALQKTKAAKEEVES